MERSREEMARIHKERCRELKLVRAKMAEELGVDLHQRECTYDGYCSGTCPKCAAEERALNEAILRRQTGAVQSGRESNVFKREERTARGAARSRVLAAGLAAIVSLGLSGCAGSTEGAAQLDGDVEQIDGGMEYVTEQTEWENTEHELEGLMPESELTEREEKPSELEGDVAPMEEAGE
ncbi:MAG: hypothetical protein J6K53_10935 [Roseburia sp.]|nr:hypothetical protein [Roseburia sp.]